MNFSIRKKLLLALLFLNSIILSIVVFFTVQSFDDGADAMSREFHLRLLKDQARSLSKHYEYYGRWDEVMEDKLVWVQLMFPGSFISSPQQRFEGAPAYTVEEILNNLPLKGPGRPRSEWVNGMLPKPPPRGKSNHKPPPPGKGVNKKTKTFIWLFDKSGEKIMGGELPEHNFEKVAVKSEGQVVGYIGRPIARELMKNTRSKIFWGASDKLFIGIGLAVVFSILAAITLSSIFVKPIKYLSKGMHDLASGNFERKLHMKSDDEFSKLGKDFNFLATALEKGKSARQQWVRDIAHELRTPLTVIGGEIELIQAGIQAPDKEIVDTLGEEIQQLKRLVNDLNTLSQSDLGALNFDKTIFNLVDMLSHYSEKVTAQLEKKSMSFVFNYTHDEILVFADEQRIKQLLDNLLQNTLRYTDAPGDVSLTVVKQKKCVFITWQDSSPGVEEKDLERLFERLFRAEASRHRALGGSGLGLSICHSIVQAHQGTIKAVPSKLGGVSIEIEWPL